MVGQAPITHLLTSLAAGDPHARDRFFRLVYDEMKQLARDHVRRAGRHGLTIDPTVLVHETWIKFERADKNLVSCTAHFYNTIAQVMRQILFDLVDRKHTMKHGGNLIQTDLTPGIEENQEPIENLREVQLALRELQSVDPELSTTVEWFYFAGLSVGEIADVRGVSKRTVKRDLAMARALLQEAMASGLGH